MLVLQKSVLVCQYQVSKSIYDYNRFQTKIQKSNRITIFSNQTLAPKVLIRNLGNFLAFFRFKQFQNHRFISNRAFHFQTELYLNKDNDPSELSAGCEIPAIHQNFFIH